MSQSFPHFIGNRSDKFSAALPRCFQHRLALGTRYLLSVFLGDVTHRLSSPLPSDYEQQRLHLLHKHGIDLEDSNGLGDGMRTKRLDRKEVERLMGGGDGQSSVFTWREKHRRKVCHARLAVNSIHSIDMPSNPHASHPCIAGIFRVSVSAVFGSKIF